MKKHTNLPNRRRFLRFAGMGAASFALLPEIILAHTGTHTSNLKDLSVQEVIDLILKEIPNAPFKETVDTLKAGKPESKVKGIVTTTFPTVEVINKTIAIGANFLIVHEPTYYNHTDETGWLKTHKAFQHKDGIVKKNNIAIWRFHDYWHSHKPDGIQTGVVKALEWEKFQNPNDNILIKLPSTTLKQVVGHVKEKLGISMVKVIGNPDEAISTIALMPGAWGGRNHIESVGKHHPDLIIVGEVNEWETSEYIRDYRAAEGRGALIILGHAVSEEAGMAYLAEWLQPKVPQIKVTHIPANEPATWM